MFDTGILLCGHLNNREQLRARIAASAALYGAEASNAEALLLYLSGDELRGGMPNREVKRLLEESGVRADRMHFERTSLHTGDEIRNFLWLTSGAKKRVAVTSWYHAPRLRFGFWIEARRQGTRISVRVVSAYGGVTPYDILREPIGWVRLVYHELCLPWLRKSTRAVA